MSNGRRVGKVIALFRYPVKSFRGEELKSVQVTERGVLGDRAYAFIDKETGKVVSAKNPKRWPGFFAFSAVFKQPPVIGAPAPPVEITLPDGSSVLSSTGEAAAAVSAALGREVILSAAPPPKPVLEEYWPDIESFEKRDTVTDEPIPPGAFFDGAALHVISTGTLEALKRGYPGGDFDPRRFRPNILIETTQGNGDFPEDGWLGRTLRIGDSLRIAVQRPCPRCVMTTLPQGGLPEDREILRTIVRLHNGAAGAYAGVVAPGGLSVGDDVFLEETTAQ